MHTGDDYTSTVPRCPRCSGTDDVERTSTNPARPWLCCGCLLVFSGTQAEAAAEARRRAIEAAQRSASRPHGDGAP